MRGGEQFAFPHCVRPHNIKATLNKGPLFTEHVLKVPDFSKHTVLALATDVRDRGRAPRSPQNLFSPVTWPPMSHSVTSGFGTVAYSRTSTMGVSISPLRSHTPTDMSAGR